MEKDFETLIASFIENKIGISEHFLSTPLANNLKDNLLALLQRDLLLAAGTGNKENLTHNTSVRSDSIYWLDRAHEDTYENEFFDQMDDFIRYLNRTCNAGINSCEFHYSLYESGSFYEKHIDRFQYNSNRQYSMISYLNANWLEADGGQLLIHQEKKNQTISPTQGKTVFFDSSELSHEVLVTNKRRMSITGWLKK
jgi:SM-20-related protein